MRLYAHLLTCGLACGAAVSAAQAAAVSASTVVDAAPCSRHWTTLFTNEIPLRWNWVPGATRARLDVVGMAGTSATNFAVGASKALWRAAAEASPSAEDVQTLVLTCYGDGDAVVGALTARVATVTGAFGRSTVDAALDGAAWPKVKRDSVIPYDAAWASDTNAATDVRMTIAKTDGGAQTNVFADRAGYYGWKIVNGGWGYGTFDLCLSFSGTTNAWSATLTRPLDGTAVSVR